MNTAISFIKKNTVMVIALLAAVITSFIVPPDEKYLDYFDYKTLACLFSVLAVVCALKNVQFFYILACNIVKKFRNIRLCTVVLVWVTFIGSMLIANEYGSADISSAGILCTAYRRQGTLYGVHVHNAEHRR